MYNGTLYLLRGLPGSGKSSMAEELRRFYNIFAHYEADMYFSHNDDRGYKFDPSKLHEAHKWCQDVVDMDMEYGTKIIIVSNTFTTNRELSPYVDLAHKYKYKLVVLTIESGMSLEGLAARNIHNVPLESLVRMDQRWEQFTL